MDLRSLIPLPRGGVPGRAGGTDPFSSFRRDIDRMFDEFGRWNMPFAQSNESFLSPKVNVAETDKGLELTAELPGVDQKDIDLDLTDNVLTLKAEHQIDKEEKDESRHYHLVERSYGTFMRRIELPFEADTDKVEASFDKGVLKVFVPRSPSAEKHGKKISVKAA